MTRGGQWLAIVLFNLGILFASMPLMAGELKPDTAFFNLYGFGSGGSDMEKMSNNAAGFGWVARGGVRTNRLGFFLEFQRDRWLATDKDIEIKNGVLNVGVGMDLLLFRDRVKMSLAAGSSTLLFDTILDKAGTTGVYFDFHPSTIRWPLTHAIILEFSPLSAIVLMPVMTDPRLKRLEYRTSIGLEMIF